MKLLIATRGLTREPHLINGVPTLEGVVRFVSSSALWGLVSWQDPEAGESGGVPIVHNKCLNGLSRKRIDGVLFFDTNKIPKIGITS